MVAEVRCGEWGGAARLQEYEHAGVVEQALAPVALGFQVADSRFQIQGFRPIYYPRPGMWNLELGTRHAGVAKQADAQDLKE